MSDEQAADLGFQHDDYSFTLPSKFVCYYILWRVLGHNVDQSWCNDMATVVAHQNMSIGRLKKILSTCLLKRVPSLHKDTVGFFVDRLIRWLVSKQSDNSVKDGQDSCRFKEKYNMRGITKSVLLTVIVCMGHSFFCMAQQLPSLEFVKLPNQDVCFVVMRTYFTCDDSLVRSMANAFANIEKPRKILKDMLEDILVDYNKACEIIGCKPIFQIKEVVDRMIDDLQASRECT